ncbi:hypothetical protein C0991_000639 [Blastosporella zonata]|nr:hypothetical protein C0991_000639 [Blastosporella zonata]
MTGNCSATKPSKATINSLTQVTGQTLAYAAIQGRFVISSVDIWSIRNGTFNYQDFYSNIVSLFEEKPENPWVVETLDWWNRQLPDLTKTRKQRK